MEINFNLKLLSFLIVPSLINTSQLKEIPFEGSSFFVKGASEVIESIEKQEEGIKLTFGDRRIKINAISGSYNIEKVMNKEDVKNLVKENKEIHYQGLILPKDLNSLILEDYWVEDEDSEKGFKTILEED